MKQLTVAVLLMAVFVFGQVSATQLPPVEVLCNHVADAFVGFETHAARINDNGYYVCKFTVTIPD